MKNRFYIVVILALLMPVLFSQRIHATPEAYVKDINLPPDAYQMQKNPDVTEFTGSMKGGDNRVLPVGEVRSEIIGVPATGVVFTATYIGPRSPGLQFILTISASNKTKTVIARNKTYNKEEVLYGSVSISDNAYLTNPRVSWIYGYIY